MALLLQSLRQRQVMGASSTKFAILVELPGKLRLVMTLLTFFVCEEHQ